MWNSFQKFISNHDVCSWNNIISCKGGFLSFFLRRRGGWKSKNPGGVKGGGEKKLGGYATMVQGAKRVLNTPTCFDLIPDVLQSPHLSPNLMLDKCRGISNVQLMQTKVAPEAWTAAVAWAAAAFAFPTRSILRQQRVRVMGQAWVHRFADPTHTMQRPACASCKCRSRT